MAKKIQIYKGTINTLYAKDFHLNKEKALETDIESMEITNESLFYYFMGKYQNIEYGTYLPDYHEARDYLDATIANNQTFLERILNDPEVSEADKEYAKAMLTRKSSCVYADYTTITPSHTVSKEEFKVLKKKGIKH